MTEQDPVPETAPGDVQDHADEVRDAEHEAEVASTLADSSQIDEATAEAETQKPETYSSADVNPSQEPVEAGASSEDMADREQAEGEAEAKLVELTTPDEPAAPKVFSTADLTGGVPGSDTERKIHDAAKPFEGETATERKLRAMGLTGPGH